MGALHAPVAHVLKCHLVRGERDGLLLLGFLHEHVAAVGKVAQPHAEGIPESENATDKRQLQWLG